MTARDDVELFGVLIFIAENWIRILLLPLFAALLAYGAVEFWPPRYAATITLAPPEVSAAAPRHAIAEAYGRVSSSDGAQVSHNGSISVTASAPSLDEAMAKAAAVYNHITEPILLAAQAEIDRISGVQEFLQTRLDGLTTLGTPEAVIGIPPFLTAINDLQKQKTAAEALRDQYVSPNIAAKSTRPSAALVATGVYLVTGIMAAAACLVASSWPGFVDTLRRRRAEAGERDVDIVEETRSVSTVPG